MKKNEIAYGIYPIATLGEIITYFVGIIGAYHIITNYMGAQRIIALMGFLLFALIWYLLKIFFRLRNLIKEHKIKTDKLNEMNEELSHAKIELSKVMDNRDTLIRINERNTNELDECRNSLAISKAQSALLYNLLLLDKKPDLKNVRHALKIDHDEVNLID